MKRPLAVLGMWKDEAIFAPHWLTHYTRFVAPTDMVVLSDGSTDNSEQLVRAAGAHFVPLKEGDTPRVNGCIDQAVPVKKKIAELLECYDVVLFAESADDIIVASETFDHDLVKWAIDFAARPEKHECLTCYQIIENKVIKAPLYDNAFAWKVTPGWGRNWHRLETGPRTAGLGNGNICNLHVHYQNFNKCNARHHWRFEHWPSELRSLFEHRTGIELRQHMDHLLSRPEDLLGDKVEDIPLWMQKFL